jgi:ATP-dependent RNA helicase RhlE
VEIRDVEGFVPQHPIRWGNSAPGKAEQPSGNRPPRRHGRRPHGDAPRQAQAHAHAGPKKHGSGGAPNNGGRRDGGRRQSAPRAAH